MLSVTNEKGNSQLSFNDASPKINDPGSGFYIHVDTVDYEEITTTSVKVLTKIDTDIQSLIISKGVCYGENENPTVDGLNSTNNNIYLDFYTQINNLLPFKKYYIRSFANTNAGVVYGDQLYFTTLQVSAPELNTPYEIGYQTNSSIELASLLISDGGEPGGITSCGFVFSKTNNTPTIGGSDCSALYVQDSVYFGGETIMLNIAGLDSDTQYYFSAFATNSHSTVYSNVILSSTLNNDPIITFDGYYNNNVNWYTFYGFYNSFVGTATKIGFVYSSVNLDPLLTDDEWTYKYQRSITSQSDLYSADITLTDTDTRTYSVKAFVEQSGVVYYSQITTFTNYIQ